MADAATALKPKDDAATAAPRALAPRASAPQSLTASGLAQREAEAEKAYTAADTELKGLQQPQLNLQPQPTPQETDPIQAWGSTAMMVAALGSLMTRAPMTTALNSASAVLNAYRKGDMDAYTAAYQQWKTSTDMALKQYKVENEAYRNALEKAKFDVNAASAMVRSYGAAYGHTEMAKLGEQRNMIAAQHLLIDREKAVAYMEALQPKIDQAAIFHENVEKLKKDPTFINADGPTQMQRLAQIMPSKGNSTANDLKVAEAVYKTQYPQDPGTGTRPGAPNFREWYQNTWPTWGSTKGPTELSDAYGVAITEVNKARDMLKSADAANYVGLRGRGARIVEGVTGQFKSDTPAPARKFEGQLETIKAMIRTLVSKAHYTGTAAQEQIDNMVQGLDDIDSLESAKNSLDHLHDLLVQKRGEDVGGPTAAPGSTAPRAAPTTSGGASPLANMSDAQLKKMLNLPPASGGDDSVPEPPSDDPSTTDDSSSDTNTDDSDDGQ